MKELQKFGTTLVLNDTRGERMGGRLYPRRAYNSPCSFLFPYAAKRLPFSYIYIHIYIYIYTYKIIYFSLSLL